MAVERKERNRAIGDRMLKNDRRAVIERPGIIAETMNAAIERGKDGRANLHKQIEADVYRAPLRAIVAFAFENVAGVKRARFVVTANANARPTAAHTVEEISRQCGSIIQLCDVAQCTAAEAEIKDLCIRRLQIRLNYAPHLIGMTFKPLNNRWCLRAGG